MWLIFYFAIHYYFGLQLNRLYYTFHGGKYDALGWTQQLVIRLLEVTHGQWLYRNVLVHDHVSGVLTTQRKEHLQTEIVHQLLLGGEGLEEEDRFLLEINMEDLETTSGETQEYWVLAISAVRAAILLQGQDQHSSTTTERDGHSIFLTLEQAKSWPTIAGFLGFQ